MGLLGAPSQKYRNNSESKHKCQKNLQKRVAFSSGWLGTCGNQHLPSTDTRTQSSPIVASKNCPVFPLEPCFLLNVLLKGSGLGGVSSQASHPTCNLELLCLGITVPSPPAVWGWFRHPFCICSTLPRALPACFGSIFFQAWQPPHPK